MPYDYYSMPFCKPDEGVKKASGTINPGTILLGIRIENSPYNFSMMVRFFVFFVHNAPLPTLTQP